MRRVRLCLFTAAVACGLAGLASPTSAAPAQHVVQYQGRLADGLGVPLEGTIGRLTFRLYSTATPTSASFLWAEAHLSTPIRRGVFSVNLGAGALTVAVDGSETPVPNPFTGEFDGGPRYLQVQVDGQAPLAPLQQLGSVPFAVSAGGSVPIGGVIDWYRPRATDPVPDGWVICDGTPITDPDSSFNGTNAPNLVGRFTRGIANTPTFGADQGPPPSAGSDSFAFTLPHGHGLTSHTHSIPNHSHTVSGASDRPSYVGSIPASGNTVASLLFGTLDHVHNFNGTTNSVALTTGGGVGGTDGASPGTTVPTVPAHVGLLKIMRTR